MVRKTGFRPVNGSSILPTATTIYHCTKMGNLISIVEKGILRSDNGCVYLSKIPCYNYGEICLEVEAKELNPELIDGGGDKEWELLYWSDIPPKAIELHSVMNQYYDGME